MGIKLNFTDQEAKSDVLEPIPAGWYKATISDGDLKQVTNAPQPGKKDNRGKPYYSLELTINEPEKYEGRKVFTNVMLFEGALYSAAQMAKALDPTITDEDLKADFEFPELEELMGQELMVKVKVTGERKVGDKTYEPRNDAAGFRHVDKQDVKVNEPAAGTKAKTGGSLLPS